MYRIPSTSYHSASVNAQKFKTEIIKLHKIAQVNCYSGEIVKSLIKKLTNKKNPNNLTPLSSINDDTQVLLLWTVYLINVVKSSQNITLKHTVKAPVTR